jgi:hypothetical protein
MALLITFLHRSMSAPASIKLSALASDQERMGQSPTFVLQQKQFQICFGLRLEFPAIPWDLEAYSTRLYARDA